ncbi:MAG: hypothetical protein GF331_01525 [Chitinivibrionales bacterium]|nr:hypothetical protein [Chitinivibrionales bacterium]
MYKQKRFGIKPEHIVEADIAEAAQLLRDRSRVFLCDGDALIIEQSRLLATLDTVHAKLPWVDRIATYANAKSIARKTDPQLHGL